MNHRTIARRTVGITAVAAFIYAFVFLCSIAAWRDNHPYQPTDWGDVALWALYGTAAMTAIVLTLIALFAAAMWGFGFDEPSDDGGW